MLGPVARAEPRPGDEVGGRRDRRRRVELQQRQVLDRREQVRRPVGVEQLGADRDPAGALLRQLMRLRHDLRMLTNRSAPPATVTPVLVYPDVRGAVAWLERAFGFEERVRIGEDHRSQMRVGEDGAIVVADVRRDQVAPSGGVVSQLIKVRVPDVDAAFAQARGGRRARARAAARPSSTASARASSRIPPGTAGS